MFDARALRRRFIHHGASDAVVCNGATYSYAGLDARIDHWSRRLGEHGVSPGDVVALVADFSVDAVALLFALAEREAVIVPLASHASDNIDRFIKIAQAGIRIDASHDFAVHKTELTGDHPHYRALREAAHPGVLLFSSGSTGSRKAVVHDLTRLLAKFEKPRKALRTIAFLQLDHIGGLNTLLHVLATGGCSIFVSDRSPDSVLQSVERYRAELLPTTPTFLNLLLVSGACARHDCSSLNLISYGTEAMQSSTLARLADTFPGVELKQTYGLSELGILRSKSRGPRSLWMKIGGEEFQTRVVDGLLEIKAQSAMLGYLNAPSPFTHDGWYRTGDAVEVDGEYLRVVARQSDVIAVGGENVYPTEIESVIQEMPQVIEAIVFGQDHPITGQIVCARVRWAGDEAPRIRRAQIKDHCSAKLTRYEAPAKIEFLDDDDSPTGFKKKRAATG